MWRITNQGSATKHFTVKVKQLTIDQLSKISWLPDVLVWRGSIIPTVAGPVLSVTLFSACVAAASLMYGKEVGLTNNVGQFTCSRLSLQTRAD